MRRVHLMNEFKRLFSIKSDQAENEEIKQRIDEASAISGTNLWILIMAIFIASIGLNVNSTAVIIGAMLISPLMGGIISIGYGFAMDDVEHIKRSLTNFGIQVFISIIVSVIYFTVSPLSEAKSELLARISPTIWDVLIAVFAGTAGLIALTRKDRVSNVVPGTAIATALMPPLCTVGYGIAEGKWNFILGAAYLFFINSFFICLVSSLGFHFMKVVDPSQEKKGSKKHIIFWSFVIISILPSVYVAWNIVNETITQNNYKNFINSQFRFEKTQVFSDKIDMERKKIDVVLIGEKISDSEIEEIKENRNAYELEKYKVNVEQMAVSEGVTEDEIKNILRGGKTVNLNGEEIPISEIIHDSDGYDEVKNELMILYPEIEEAGIAQMRDKDGEETKALIIKSQNELDLENLDIIKKWIKEKTGSEMEIIQSIDTVTE